MKLKVLQPDPSNPTKSIPTIWTVHIHHTHIISHHATISGYGQMSRSFTTVRLHEGTCDDKCQHTKLHGTASCHPNDNFNRALGRKIAFTRALSGLDKATRAALWAAYLSTVKGTNHVPQHSDQNLQDAPEA